MVNLSKGNKTCWPTFFWLLLATGYCLMAITKADSVVIHAERETIDDVPALVQRQGLSLENCADVCAKEKQITCKFFKFLSKTGICLLSSTDNPEVSSLATQSLSVAPEEVTLGQKSLSTWISELEDKVETYEDQESDVENLKIAVNDIRNELKMLRKYRISESHRARAIKESQQIAHTQLTRNIVGLKVEGETFKAAVHALSNMQRVLAKEISEMKDEQKDVLLKVSEVEKSAGDMNSLVSSLKTTDGSTQRELDSLKDGTNDLTTNFVKLKDRINQEIAKKQMPPGMMKLKHNQGALATALESMMDKVTNLRHSMPFLEKEMHGTNQKVTNQAMYERELQSKLKILYQNLFELKKSVHNLLDPRSTVNLERAKGVLKLKSDVSMLAEMDKGLKNELQVQREDMGRLVKDVARVQLMAQNLRDKLSLVMAASRQFQQDIFFLKRAQKNGMSVSEVAQMQKRVLVALNRLKTRESILMKHLQKYRASVKSVAHEVTHTENKKTHTQHMVVQLQRRLRRLDKQLQLLFEKTKSLTKRLEMPRTPKSVKNVLATQARVDSKVGELMKGLQSLMKKVTVLTFDLRQVKGETEDEKRDMGLEVKAGQREMDETEGRLGQLTATELAESDKSQQLRDEMLKVHENNELDRIKQRMKDKRKDGQETNNAIRREKQKPRVRHRNRNRGYRKKKKKNKQERKKKGKKKKGKKKNKKTKKKGKKKKKNGRGGKWKMNSGEGQTEKWRKHKLKHETWAQKSALSKERSSAGDTIVLSDNTQNAQQAVKAVGAAAEQKELNEQQRKRQKQFGHKVKGKGKRKGRGKGQGKMKRKGKGSQGKMKRKGKGRGKRKRKGK